MNRHYHRCSRQL